MKTLDQLFDWTDLTNLDTDADPRPVRLDELPGDQIFLIPHHAYNRKVQDTIALSKPGGKQVSMTGAMGPVVAGAEQIVNVLVVPWRTHRPFTTASWIDNQAITFEISNKGLDYPYPVQQASKQRLAEVAAAMHVELGMPLNTWHIVDHQGVYERGWDSYPTACCGDDLREDIPWVIAEAKRIVAVFRAGGGSVTPTPDEEEENMKPFLIHKVNPNKTVQWALISGDLARMVPIWRQDTANGLAKNVGPSTLVVETEWQGFVASSKIEVTVLDGDLPEPVPA